MSYSEPARTACRRTRSTILAATLVVVTAVLIGVLGYPSLAASSSPATSPKPIALRPHDSPRRDHQGAPDEADVVVPDGTTVFNDDIPAVANLDPKLLRALRRAATDAAGDAVEFSVNSGWRSRKHQEQLFREAVSKYGSKEEAARWVATPGTSAHETGNAVDLGHSDATWLSDTAPCTGCARSTATNPGTTSYGPTPSITAARLRTPTPRRIQGRTDDQHARLIMIMGAVNMITFIVRARRTATSIQQESGACCMRRCPRTLRQDAEPAGTP
jgi:zinc D-Ala-D-Ala carboxypeptidase